MNLIRLIFSSLFLSMLVGCSMVAPNYNSDFSNINKIKNLDLKKIQSGEFTESHEVLKVISLRGSSLVSPYGSYSQYLQKALEEELKQAGIWNDASDIIIKGELLSHDIDARGFSVGETDISARFMVFKSSEEIYNKIHTTHHVWDSSFVGAVAIPNAINSYPRAVQILMAKLFNDKELLDVLRK